MLSPYIPPMGTDFMYKHFARNTYSEFLTTLRLAEQLDGLDGVRQLYFEHRLQCVRENKMPHVLRALDNAYLTFLTNCRELDITPILRQLGKVN